MAAYICSRCALRPQAIEAASSTIVKVKSAPSRTFTSSTTRCYPRENNGKIFRGRDANRMRGTSAMRGTGLNPRTTLSVKLEDLAVPVDESERTPLKINDAHGLWDFLGRKRQAIMTPVELSQHGRSWTLVELETKSWDELHTLWWLCVKERNRLYTDELERRRLRAGYGDLESGTRDKAVQKTMRNIKETLLTRHTAYNEARRLAEDDEEIQVVDGKIQYTPKAMQIDEVYEADDVVENANRQAQSQERRDTAVTQHA